MYWGVWCTECRWYQRFLLTVLFCFQTPSYLLSNLAVSDFLMGIYMMIIGATDVHYRGDYARHDTSWRQSKLCTLAGFLSTFSGELSVLTLTVIAVDRFLATALHFGLYKLSVQKVKLVLLSLWIFTLTICAVPLLNNSYFSHFYGPSEMCLPVPVASERQAELVVEWPSLEGDFYAWYDDSTLEKINQKLQTAVQSSQTISKLPNGWEYSVFVFVGINGLSFLVIVTLYVLVFISINKIQRAARSPDQRDELEIARKMLLIVCTDAACWLPVIGIGIHCLQGNVISMRVNTVDAVVIATLLFLLLQPWSSSPSSSSSSSPLSASSSWSSPSESPSSSSAATAAVATTTAAVSLWRLW